jgi:putative methyltransferase (TIGR04325 family)
MNKQLNEDTKNYIWDGIYHSFDEACKNSGDFTFGIDIWLEKIANQLHDYRDKIKQYNIAMPPRYSNLLQISGISKPNIIIDYGGSSGWCWDYLKNSIPNNNVKSYVVIETNDVVNFMINSGLQKKPVEFTTIDKFSGYCDLLYSNSALQYSESNKEFISLIASASPKYILLDDLVAIGKSDFFTVQNFYNYKIPYRFIGLTTLLNEILGHGYVEIIRSPYVTTNFERTITYEMANFPKQMRLQHSLSILLGKK